MADEEISHYLFADPTFEKSFYTFSLDENNGEGSFVGLVRAGDLDVGDNGAIRYFLQQPFQAQFQIDPISGEEPH